MFLGVFFANNLDTGDHYTILYIAAVESHFASLKADIKEESINKIVFNYTSPSYGACLTAPNTLYSLAQDNKKLQRLIVPKEKPKKVCAAC